MIRACSWWTVIVQSIPSSEIETLPPQRLRRSTARSPLRRPQRRARGRQRFFSPFRFLLSVLAYFRTCYFIYDPDSGAEHTSTWSSTLNQNKITAGTNYTHSHSSILRQLEGGPLRLPKRADSSSSVDVPADVPVDAECTVVPEDLRRPWARFHVGEGVVTLTATGSVRSTSTSDVLRGTHSMSSFGVGWTPGGAGRDSRVVSTKKMLHGITGCIFASAFFHCSHRKVSSLTMRYGYAGTSKLIACAFADVWISGLTTPKTSGWGQMSMKWDPTLTWTDLLDKAKKHATVDSVATAEKARMVRICVALASCDLKPSFSSCLA